MRRRRRKRRRRRTLVLLPFLYLSSLKHVDVSPFLSWYVNIEVR